MTTAATHRHGCRRGTASMAAGEPVGSDLAANVNAHRSIRDQLVAPLMTGLSIMPASTPQFDRDRLVVAAVDQVLERLLQRRRQRRALRDGPTVGRRVERLARLLELAVALLDRVQGHRRVRRHGVGLAEDDRVGGLVLSVELHDVDGGLARVGARLALGGQLVGLLGRRGLHRDLLAAGVVGVDVEPCGLAHSEPAEK